ncbi:MAG: hypothetical protein IT450_12465 [Phycisphaerales bacterium]|nr:hypothetical protein [Phycisphaerales bacterium]
MEMSRGLMIVLGLLSLGLCMDAVNVFSSHAAYIFVFLLAARIAAIGGILTRSYKGYLAALSFFLVIILLNVLAGAAAGAPTAAIPGIVLPLVCIIILFACRGEFD